MKIDNEQVKGFGAFFAEQVVKIKQSGMSFQRFYILLLLGVLPVLLRLIEESEEPEQETEKPEKQSENNTRKASL